MNERRRSRRIADRIPVKLHTSKRVLQLSTADVSRHGCFIETASPLAVRHIGKVTIDLPQTSFGAVVQVTRQNDQGMGVEFFALSKDAKHLWASYFGHLSKERPVTNIIDDVVFVVKLRSPAALRTFFEGSFAEGGTYLRTPVLHAIGTPITLTVVHPFTEAEFPLRGTVARLRVKEPKGIEIRFTEVAAIKDAFARFVKDGEVEHSEDAVPLDIDFEFDDEAEFDIDIVDLEEEPDIEEIFDWDEVDESLMVDPSVWDAMESGAVEVPSPVEGMEAETLRFDATLEDQSAVDTHPPIGPDDEEVTGSLSRRKQKRQRRKQRRKKQSG